MTEPLLKIATTAAPTVDKSVSVREAVHAMVQAHLGAVCVLDDCKIAGVFTERDLMEKVVERGLDPATTPVSEMMQATPVCVTRTTGRGEAIDLMIRNRFRHLPITDEDGCLVGMLSLRDLLGHQLTRLRDEVNSLELYLSADSPGG
jgi:CBS domain-containing protein